MGNVEKAAQTLPLHEIIYDVWQRRGAQRRMHTSAAVTCGTQVRRCLALGTAVICMGLVLCALAQAAPCDQRLQPLPGGLGYRLRQDDIRCEGLYASTVSAPSLEVVSLLIGELRFALESDVRLVVSVPDDLRHRLKTPVQVRAVALPLATYYRLDAQLPLEGALAWPVAHVLRPAGLHAERVGVFGWVVHNDEKLFIPLQVTPEGQAQERHPMKLVVRSPKDAESLVWRAYMPAAQDQRLPAWVEGGAVTPIPAGHPVPLVIPNGPTGIMRVEVAAKELNSNRWATLRIQIIRLSWE
jgi:hypothetical protein